MTAEYREIKFSDSDVANPGDYIPRGDYNPHNVRPWLIHDAGFVLAVVFASCEQDALDEAVDRDKLDHFMLNPEDRHDRECYGRTDPETGQWDWNESVTFLGNASEPFDIENVGIVELPNPAFSFVALFTAA